MTVHLPAPDGSNAIAIEHVDGGPVFAKPGEHRGNRRQYDSIAPRQALLWAPSTGRYGKMAATLMAMTVVSPGGGRVRVTRVICRGTPPDKHFEIVKRIPISGGSA
jgi:hypothetical protein